MARICFMMAFALAHIPLHFALAEAVQILTFCLHDKGGTQLARLISFLGGTFMLMFLSSRG